MSIDAEYRNCPKTDWNNGHRQCPYKCGVDCKRNAKVQRAAGKRARKAIENATWDDVCWSLGIGKWGQ